MASLRCDDIDTVIYRESVNLSDIGSAMALGSAVGSGCGYIISADNANDASGVDWETTLLGLGAGLGAGLVYGLIVNAGREQIVVTSRYFSGQRMKALSMYPSGEPDFLKEVW